MSHREETIYGAAFLNDFEHAKEHDASPLKDSEL
jgi:hypothetical protein